MDEQPKLGLGCAHLGNLFREVSESDATTAIEAAWSAGIRYFDTAPWYGHGLSECRVGAALRGKPRGDFLLSTKVGRVYDATDTADANRDPWLAPLPYAMRYDYSAAGFADSLAQSRLRMGIAKIDMLVIHDLDTGHHGDARATHEKALADSGLAYLKSLRDTGEISAIGMGINATEEFRHFAERLDVDFFLVAMPYTLLDQQALHGPMRVCAERGIGIVIGAPFASGLLADPRAKGATYGYGKTSEEVRTRAIRIEDICLEHGVPIAAAALRFPLLHPAVRSVIPGAVNAEQVTCNAALMEHDIPAALWSELKSEGLIDPDSPTEVRI
jgi:D-threo-aldose 1-dehydrogenase